MDLKSDLPTSEQAVSVRVELGERVHRLQVAGGETIFTAAHKAGLCPPFSCVAGVCGECVATLDAGEVEMRTNRALSSKQLGRGLILTCQATPLGEGCRIRFGDHPSSK
ncbi:MAG: 2Fe-2S iron-sulfur cluster binding domain-containing protein [Myxococcota bacterium]|nr:2Fe-2S iron-sulfur cluster binding domain-containing protein [Myxococcota bacterium]